MAGSLEAKQNYEFDRITIEDGLPNSVVYSIIQGQLGFVWLATEGGLIRYDGYEFKEFRSGSDPLETRSLLNNSISDLCQIQTGAILAATWGGGLNFFNPHTETFTYAINKVDAKSSLSDNRVQTVFEDHYGNIWAGTYRGGLNKLFKADFDAALKKSKITNKNPDFPFTRYMANDAQPHSLSNNRVWFITEDKSGYIWIGTDKGLNRFDPISKAFTHYVSNPDDPTTLSNNRVRFIFIDGNSTYWIGTQNGLNRFDPDTGQFERFYIDPHNPERNIITNIIEDRNVDLWVGTEKSGLCIFNRRSQTFTVYAHDPLNLKSVSSDNIRDIVEDFSGILWVGTRGGGVNKADLKPTKFSHIKYNLLSDCSLTNPTVTSIYEDETGLLWLGTDGGGLNIVEIS